MTDAASRFHALHHGPKILILPNAWDAISAKIIEDAGASAIATSSAAVAWAHGYADGHHLPFALLLQTAQAIIRVVNVPVTVDCEGGYADEPGAVADNIRALLQAGVVGINLEDGRTSHDDHRRKIESIRQTADQAGINLFINARTDVFLKGLVPEGERLAETIRRARSLKDAGASGLFVPMLKSPADIADAVKATDLPLNIMGWTGIPDAHKLQALGVRRLSAATHIARAAWTIVDTAARQFLHTGDSEALNTLAGAPKDYNAAFLPKDQRPAR